MVEERAPPGLSKRAELRMMGLLNQVIESATSCRPFFR